jgi:hypothetical protein
MILCMVRTVQRIFEWVRLLISCNILHYELHLKFNYSVELIHLCSRYSITCQPASSIGDSLWAASTFACLLTVGRNFCSIAIRLNEYICKCVAVGRLLLISVRYQMRYIYFRIEALFQGLKPKTGQLLDVR